MTRTLLVAAAAVLAGSTLTACGTESTRPSGDGSSSDPQALTVESSADECRL